MLLVFMCSHLCFRNMFNPLLSWEKSLQMGNRTASEVIWGLVALPGSFQLCVTSCLGAEKGFGRNPQLALSVRGQECAF